LIGGVVWVALFTFAGYFFGTIPFVQENFEFVIVAIVLISLVPIAIEWWKARNEKKQLKAEA
jgi:membrane-associated protein